MSGRGEIEAGGAGVLLLCAGRGRRMGLDEVHPKALLDLGGRPLAAYSLDVFEVSKVVGSVVVVAPPGLSARFSAELVGPGGFKKVAAIVDGGETRQASVKIGLDHLDDSLDPVLVHDAARPMVTSGLVAACASTAAATGACVPGIQVSSTVKVTAVDGTVQKTLDRERLLEVQTPQGFRGALLRKAHLHAVASGIEGTDDSALVESLGAAVAVIDGDHENIKITRPVDLELAGVLLRHRARDRSR